MRESRQWEERLMDYPYSEIALLVSQYTDEHISLGESDYEAHRKILNCMLEMNKIICDLVDNNASCLLHPHARVRQLARKKV